MQGSQKAQRGTWRLPFASLCFASRYLIRMRFTLLLGPRSCTACGSDEVVRSRRRRLLGFVILPLALLRPLSLPCMLPPSLQILLSQAVGVLAGKGGCKALGNVPKMADVFE